MSREPKLSNDVPLYRPTSIADGIIFAVLAFVGLLAAVAFIVIVVTGATS